MITFLQAAEVAATEEARMGLWELFTKGGWLDFAANSTGALLASLVAYYVVRPRMMKQ